MNIKVAAFTVSEKSINSFVVMVEIGTWQQSIKLIVRIEVTYYSFSCQHVGSAIIHNRSSAIKMKDNKVQFVTVLHGIHEKMKLQKL